MDSLLYSTCKINISEKTIFTGNKRFVLILQLLSNTSGDQLMYIVSGLKPYTNHTLKIGACNTMGCINSTEVYGFTHQAGKGKFLFVPTQVFYANMGKCNLIIILSSLVPMRL